VLLLDFDPQANASAWYGILDGGRGLLDALCGEAQLGDLVRSTQVDGVDVIPSSTWLVGLERAMAGEVGAELCLRDRIQELAPDRWDVLLIDCTPTLGLLVVSALAAADEVLVPVEAQVMPLAGLAALTKTIERVRQRLNPKLTLSGILPCRVQSRTNLARDVLARLHQTFPGIVFDTVIRENVRLAESWSFHQPITQYDPRSAGAEDYRAAAAELVARWNDKGDRQCAA
jgi:chromosome partitioning protein